MLVTGCWSKFPQPTSIQYPATSIVSFMPKPEITAYLKTQCGWSAGVRALLKKYDIAYTEKDIIQNPAFRWELEQKSRQPVRPCVEVNGQMLTEISGEAREQSLIPE